MTNNILEDVLGSGMLIVFCGMAVGTQSKEAKAFFAGKGNKFWQTLRDIKLTDRKLEPCEYKQVKKYNIGLTDLIKKQFGSDNVVRVSDDDRDILRAKIEKYQPRILAFNGKKAAQLYFKKRKIEYGGQRNESIGATRIFVLPSTSGAANGYWNKAYWRKISNLVINT